MTLRPHSKLSAGSASAEAQLRSFIAKFAPEDQKLIRAVRAAVRRRIPAANELVWDNYNFFVIGYSPTERPSDSILSVAARANGVGLCFIHGARLPDPKKLLLGSGTQTRFIRVESAGVLAHPDVEALVTAAIDRAKTPLPARGRGRLIICSVATKQRPRRKPAEVTARGLRTLHRAVADAIMSAASGQAVSDAWRSCVSDSPNAYLYQPGESESR